MKIALLTDSHWGARNDSLDYLNYFSRFHQNIFFPYLKRENIKTVIHLGDVFDRRKYINFNTLNAFHKSWTKHIQEQDISVHSIIGNHDVYYRNTNDVSSQKLLIDSDNTIVYSKPKEIELGDIKIAMLPWVNRQNHDECVEFIKKTKAPVLMGHLELTGYEVVRGVQHNHGMDPALFSKFTKVFSGHFHIKQHKHNVDYLGTPYEITFGDVNMKKGFHVFDTETLQLDFIENREKMHLYIPYDDTEDIDYLAEDMSLYTGKMVKVRVINKTDSYTFEKFIENLSAAEPIKYSIIDKTDIATVLGTSGDDNNIDSKDTMSILIEYIDENFDDQDDRDAIGSLMQELYSEAVSAE